jgi:hypothetical protein
VGDPLLITRLPLALLAATLTLAAGAYFQPVYAQCAAGTKIYIKPSLVPQRPQISRQQFIYGGMEGTSPEQRALLNQFYYSQHQPIQIPYRNGVVLINPTNPCDQQYIGR